MALFRAKWQTEQALAASGMQWTSVRATAFMETWASLLGTPVLAGKRALVFGRGDNPINFVSATDVAALVLAVLDDPRSFGRNIEIGGLENLTMNEVVARFGAAVGATPRVRHVPIALMRAARGTVGRIAKPVGEQLTAGISMATAPLTFNPTSTLAEWPVPSTNLDAVIARMALQRNT